MKMLRSILLVLFLFLAMACMKDIMTPKISKPDQYKHIYEAKEALALRAIAIVMQEKKIGENVVIDYKNHQVLSDYTVSGEWRTKANARIRQINWKECEVTLSVMTEKKTETGWELHRLLEKEQYETFFSVIEMKIYEEMAKVR